MKIRTELSWKPLPTTRYDWSAWDDDTYCCPECHSPVGHGATEAEAIADLKGQMEEA